MSSIGDWISEHITEPLQEMIIDSVNGVLITMLNSAVDMVTSVMGQELKILEHLLENTYIVQAVTYSITMALILVAVRIGFDGFRTYIAYSTGQENHPGELIKNAVTATIMIVSTPWIAKQALTFSLSIVDDIMGLQAVPSVELLPCNRFLGSYGSSFCYSCRWHSYEYRDGYIYFNWSCNLATPACKYCCSSRAYCDVDDSWAVDVGF